MIVHFYLKICLERDMPSFKPQLKYNMAEKEREGHQ